MNENGATEEDARKYIRSLISNMWKKINEERAADSPFSQTFIEIAKNLGKMAHCMYQYGNRHGVVDRETKKRILSLFIHPVPLHICI
jgi:(-)-alpha-terpineol synthase